MSDTISLPSILIAGALIFLAIRYFFSPATPTNARRAGSTIPGTRQVDIAKVNQVSQMFPQLDRRAIAWDLSRNGGSVPATTERVLGGQALDIPPPSFQPANLTPATSSTSTGRSPAIAAKPHAAQDLISRYNLSSKLKTQEDDSAPSTTDGEAKVSTGWASTKAERAAIFAKRREEMILTARKNMEDAARREAKGKGKAVE